MCVFYRTVTSHVILHCYFEVLILITLKIYKYLYATNVAARLSPLDLGHISTLAQQDSNNGCHTAPAQREQFIKA